jgi:hypothetical protein
MNEHSTKVAVWLLLLVIVIITSAVGCTYSTTGNIAITQHNQLRYVLAETLSTYNSVNDVPDIDWTRYGVVLNLGKPGDYDNKNIESPLVIKHNNDDYVMFYRGQCYEDDIGRVLRAVSGDGINWVKTGVVMIPTEYYEGNKIDPMSVMYEDEIYKMWYGGQSYGGTVCYATSIDGINWIRYPTNPILRKTSGAWDNEGAGGQHTIVKNGDIYQMLYKGNGSKQPGWTYYGLAQSTDGIHWEKKGKVISPQPELGETTLFRNLFALKIGNSLYLMHTMVDYLHLYILQSIDGINWNNKGVIFRHGLTPGNFDAKWATSPCLIEDGDIIKMWYEGGDFNGRVRTLYAEIDKKVLIESVQNTMIIQPQK